ncbi:hypothetical protein KFL_001630080 [Klebsormidium nitens]|uniref:YHYH domain-containing protein n=1 Tax=Klebsormidium nitens TaxID=105231 RepID=A0A1Y1HYS4_KLENI|nr:hypothetical protein KFL_001630080 [Klebsormidium nitens]|eukprot:GAQ83810.1 hypothetical protein KFL_001630080 [Klebsormidium nitens]
MHQTIATFSAVLLLTGLGLVTAQGNGGPGGGAGMMGRTAGNNTNPLCGTTANAPSVNHTIQGGVRYFQSNGCPPTNWTDHNYPAPNGMTYGQARSYNFPVIVNQTPVLQANISDALYVGISNPVKGPIGITLTGVALYSAVDALNRDAIIYEGRTFDTCGGHSTPDPVNTYHYHSMPGDSSTISHNGTRNSNFTYCPAMQSWLLPVNTTNNHSALFGVFVDGVPIYGPLGDGGKLPTDLDACNGHVDASHSFYHYHATSDYPYLVDCLRGCINSTLSYIQGATIPACKPAAQQYNYSSLDAEITARLEHVGVINGTMVNGTVVNGTMVLL